MSYDPADHWIRDVAITVAVYLILGTLAWYLT
jgi:hypothetical protein